MQKRGSLQQIVCFHDSFLPRVLLFPCGFSLYSSFFHQASFLSSKGAVKPASEFFHAFCIGIFHRSSSPNKCELHSFENLKSECLKCHAASCWDKFVSTETGVRLSIVGRDFGHGSSGKIRSSNYKSCSGLRSIIDRLQ